MADPVIDPTTPPSDPNAQRIAANVAKMRAGGATDGEVEHYVRDIEGLKPTGSILDANGQIQQRLPGTRAGTPESNTYHARYKAGTLAPQMASENAQDEGLQPTYAGQVLGGVASLARDVPGAEAGQAAITALASRVPVLRGSQGPIGYREARHEINETEDQNPASSLNRVAGGGMAMAAIPGGPALQGARYGILQGLGTSDPDADPLNEAAKRGAISALVGGVVGAGTNLVRSAATPSLGSQALARTAQMSDADAINYGRVAQEAANAGGTSPAVKAALADPRLAQYVGPIENSMTYGNASDADKLQAALRFMNEKQGQMIRRIGNTPDDFLAGTELGKQEIAARKAILKGAAASPSTIPAVTTTLPAITRDIPAMTTAQSPPPTLREAIDAFQSRSGVAAARNEGTVAQQMARQALERHSAEDVVSPSLRGSPPGPQTVEMAPSRTVQLSPERNVPPAMPSLAKAMEAHSNLAGQYDAAGEAADATKRLLKGAKPAWRKVLTNTPEGYQAGIPELSPEEAKAASEGVLGSLKNFTGPGKNPFTGFGLGPSLYKASKVSPFLNALDEQSGNFVPGLVRGGVTAEGSNAAAQVPAWLRQYFAVHQPQQAP